MKKAKLKHTITMMGLFSLLFLWNTSHAQLDSCEVNTPFYYVDLTGQPEAVWISPSHERGGGCCDENNCTSFEIILDTNAAALSFNVYSGAIPSGSMFFQIDCGPQYPVGELICLSGVGPHRITFCKPGFNPNEYIITSIAKPTFPEDDTTRSGCSKDIKVLGFDESTISWSSVFPGNPGDYDYLLSCTDSCSTTTFTPEPTSPPYIDYVVCGFPQADECGYILTLCDTFRIYTMDSLVGSVSPNPGTFCQLGPGSGINLTATVTGGNNVYDYTWTDTSGTVVGTNSSYFATSQQTYTLEINDGLSSSSCAAEFLGVPVVETSQPIVDAGEDQLLCPNVEEVNLVGSLEFATGSYWSGGNGTFSPDSSYLSNNYIPTPAEIASGLIELYLTSTGAGGSCSNVTDTIQIAFPTPVVIQMEDTTLLCSESTTLVSPVVTGGIGPYEYLWSNGLSTETINAGEGNYCLAITDAVGCVYDSCINITVPSALDITMSSSAASSDGGNDGDASVVSSGGTSPYQYLWSPGSETTSSITGLSYGIYTVTVTDDNGCTIEGSVVVNEPRCLGFSGSTTTDSLSCYSDATATATAIATGGTSPYAFLWDDPLAQSTPTITNLSAGLYSVTITDDNTCLAVATAYIFQPDQLVNTITTSNVNFVGGNDGSATANPFGGVIPYGFSWSSGATTQTASSLTAGTYYLTITDDNTCTLVDSANVNEPPCNNFMTYTSGTDLTCNNSADGTANVFVVGGDIPYDILWSTGETTNTISGLTAGNYSVEVTDSNLCYSFNTITISQPDVLQTAIVSSDISCYGETDGTGDLSVAGGTYPYAYNWSNEATSQDVVFLGTGTHVVTVTDYHNCSIKDSIVITEPSPMSMSYIKEDVSCFGDSTASINLTTSGGVLPYSYTWSTGDTIEDLIGIPAGLYWANVEDANNCTFASALNIQITEPEVVDLDSFYIHCPVPGDSLTTIDFFPTGGTAPYQLSTDSGNMYSPYESYSSTLSIDNEYFIMIKDTNSCTSAFADTIQILPAVKIDSVVFEMCYGLTQTETEVEVFPSGGTNTLFQVSFDNGVSFEPFGDYTDSLVIGNEYYISVKDSNACLSVNDTINIPDRLIASSLVTSSYNGQDISCFGLSDGSVSSSATGGTLPYSYIWGDGQNNSSATNLAAGMHYVTITDVNDCVDSSNITLTQPELLTQMLAVVSDYNGQDISCFGLSDGSANTSASGGTLPYSFVWNDGQNDSTATNLAAGTHYVTITDVNDCVDSSNITLTQPELLSQMLAVISDYNGQDISCFGLSDGSANTSASGGTLPYSFVWNDGQNDSTATNLAAGTHYVTITDVNDCVDYGNITLTQPELLSQMLAVVSDYNGQDISCFGLSDGSANTSASGGTLPYSFVWNDGQNDSTATNLAVGTHYVTITDVNDCVDSSSITLTQPELLTHMLSVVSDYNGQNISCFGLSDGSANTSASGGTLPYSFIWDDGQGDSTATNLAAGTHYVTITDVNNCPDYGNITLTQPELLTQMLAIVSDYNGQDISCFGLSDGSANTSASGGTLPYSFIWNDGQNDSTATNLAVGTHYVTITDVNDCVDSSNITLTQPELLTQMLAVVSDYNGQDISCFGLSDGSANTSASGGTLPYTFVWNNGQNDSTAVNLAAGTHYVTITDVNDCVDSSSITLTQPELLTHMLSVASDYNGQNISCFGLSDGAANVSASGGTLPYSFVWDNGQNDSTATSLAVGTHYVTITDVNNCIDLGNITLTQPELLSQVLTTTSDYNGYNISCFGLSDGSAKTSVSGGTLPYSFIWSDGQTSNNAVNLEVGTYYVSTYDNNGCFDIKDITINQPDSMSIFDIIDHVKCNAYTDGSIDISLIGGVNPYQFNWSTGANSEDLLNVGAGKYFLSVSDLNSCLKVKTYDIEEENPLIIVSTSEDVSCYGFADAKIDIDVSGGVLPYSYAWDNGSSDKNIDGLLEGLYNLEVRDSNNCFRNETITINQPDSLWGTIESDLYFNGHNVSLFDKSDGSIDLEVFGGSVPYSYVWSNEETTQDITNIKAGAYSVIITDDNGCTITKLIELSEPFALEMPTVITPNGDGKNDQFHINGLESYPSNKILIFNRWGDLIYSDDNYDQRWNGDDLPAGNYYIILNINSDAIILTGFVEIIR